MTTLTYPVPRPVESDAPADAVFVGEVETDDLFQDARDLLDSAEELPPFDVPGLIAAGAITVLGGYTGDGKTPLTARLVRAAFAGEDFLGTPIERWPDEYKVVWLTQESRFTFRPLLLAAGLGEVLDSGQLEILYLHDALAYILDKNGAPSWPKIVEAATERVGPRGLLIVDPLSDWALVKSEDDNAVMAEAFRPVIASVGGGRSAWIIAHSWKGFRNVPDEDADVMHIRGGGAIVSNASIVVLYKKPRENVGDNIRFLKVARSRFGVYPDPLYVELTEDGKLQQASPFTMHVNKQEDAEERVLTALEENPDGVKNGDLPEMTGLTTQRVSDALKQLKRDGKVHFTGTKGSRKDPYIWHRSETTEEATDDA